MLGRHHAVLEVPMAEEVGVTVGIIAPRRRRIRVPPVVLTAIDAVGPAVTGGAAVRAGAGGQGSAIAAEHEGLEVPKQSAPGRGQGSTRKQQVFQAPEPVVGTGLGGGRPEGLGPAFADGVRLAGIGALERLALGFFGSLVISGVLNYLIFQANKAYPDRSRWIRWNKCLMFRIP